MPLNKDIKKVLVIGSGPIVIGQAAEFDYAGAQACRVLKDEGIEVVLVNSNPATIMTDKALADHIYLEPLTEETAEDVFDWLELAGRARSKKVQRRYLEKGRFPGWIRVITYHSISEYYRKQKRLPTMEAEIPEDIEKDAPNESLFLSLESVYSEIDKRINELEPKDQKLLTLRFYKQKTFREISDEMGMKKPTCIKRISALCVKLNQELQEQGIHELPEILR